MMAKSILSQIRKIRSNQKGIVMVWMALTLTVLLGFAALAVDLGFAYIVSNELKSISDAGALEAARTYTAEIRDKVDKGIPLDAAAYADIVKKTRTNTEKTIDQTIVVNKAKVGAISYNLDFGTYTDDQLPYDEKVQKQFKAGVPPGTKAAPINAFQVTVSRAASPTFISKVLGFVPFPQSRNSVSMLAPRNFVLALDTSGSMDNQNYVPPAGGLDIFGIWENDETFVTKYREPGQPDGTLHFSAHAPAPVAFAGFPPMAPEPLKSVLDSSLSFLTQLADGAFFADSAGVIYFSDLAETKLDIQKIDKSAVSGGVFDTLLKNDGLYGNLVQASAADILANGGKPYYVLPVYETSVDKFPDKNNIMTGQQRPANAGDPMFAIPFGRTNQGAAIAQAINGIDKATLTSRSIAVIILFTDGIPTCKGPTVKDCYDDPLTDAQLTASINYTFAQAIKAINGGVVVIPISYIDFATVPDGMTITQMNNVKNMLDQIARLSGIDSGHYNILPKADPKDIQKELDKIFNEISTLIPFVLVG